MGCQFSTVKRNFTEDDLTHEIDYDHVYTIYRNPPSAPTGNDGPLPPYTQTNSVLPTNQQNQVK